MKKSKGRADRIVRAAVVAVIAALCLSGLVGGARAVALGIAGVAYLLARRIGGVPCDTPFGISSRVRLAGAARRGLLVALLLGVSPARPAHAEGAAAAIADGDAAVGAFDLEAAGAAYRRALEREPESYEAAWKLARTRLDEATLAPEGEEDGALLRNAERFARRAVEANPDGAMGHAFLAIALGRRAQNERGRRRVELSREVKTQAEAAIELDPEVDLPYHVLGVWHREMAGLNAVLRRFAEWFYGGLPKASLEEAELNLRRAAELAPEVVAHRVELGITLAARNRRSEAREVLEAAIEMPQTWVTDEHFRERASAELRRLR